MTHIVYKYLSSPTSTTPTTPAIHQYTFNISIQLPQSKVKEDGAFVLAGEWIGPKIQNVNVAIGKLAKRCFVIISVQINGDWLPDQPYTDISDEASEIYNIPRGGFYSQVLPYNNGKGDLSPALGAMQLIADQVEAECPFAKSLGITGRGEGIIWRAESPLCHKAKFWIKMKGPIMNGTNIPDKKHSTKSEFIRAVVSPERRQQGLGYLKKTISSRRGNISAFSLSGLRRTSRQKRSLLPSSGR